jgi:triosephosphate isomerase (TIM)
MRTLVAGNWKMHKDNAGTNALLDAICKGAAPAPGVEVLVAPAFPFLAQAVQRCKGTAVHVAAQNCHEAAQGAFTGEVSVPMLGSLGVGHCIVGHSERRLYFGETDRVVGQKMSALLHAGIVPIYCCGERKEERLAGEHEAVVARQLEEALGALTTEQMAQVVIAYEPVWAIGTGLTATAQQAQEMHAHVRAWLQGNFGAVARRIPLLYGGSCKPENAAELFACPDVNGGLIGGAALDAATFLAIVHAAGHAPH